MPFRDDHAEAFYRLNRSWLDAHDLYEPADEPTLADPRGTVIDEGGAVFIAERDGVVIGTAAVAPYAPGEVELVKVTVAESARGSGLGRRLVDVCIAQARLMGARRLVLVSSSRLTSALRLYERMGFAHGPLPPNVPYETADVFMTLDL